MAEHPLWAPWRIEYIRAPKGDDACVFCSYAAHGPAEHAADLTLVAAEHAFVTLNRFPFAAGHLLVIPRRHTADLAELTLDEYDSLFRLVGESVTRLKRALGAQGINVGINLGSAAGAGIAEHLHVHVVPRWGGDTNFMPVLADVRVIPQALEATWAELYEAFADIAGSRAPAPQRPTT